jgi:hypothetical protein
MPIVTRNDPYRCPPWWRKERPGPRKRPQERWINLPGRQGRYRTRAPRPTGADNLRERLHGGSWAKTLLPDPKDRRRRLQIRLRHQPIIPPMMFDRTPLPPGKIRLPPELWRRLKRRLQKVAWRMRPKRRS